MRHVLVEHGGDGRAGVFDVQVDVTRAQRAVADECAAEVQLAHDREAFGLDRLRQQLSQHDLFGEVLRSDDDARAG